MEFIRLKEPKLKQRIRNPPKHNSFAKLTKIWKKAFASKLFTSRCAFALRLFDKSYSIYRTCIVTFYSCYQCSNFLLGSIEKKLINSEELETGL